jgi:hypothetical protein
MACLLPPLTMNNVYYVESIKRDWINIIVLKEWEKVYAQASRKMTNTL